LSAVDGTGADLELNYFLETPPALAWTLPKRFTLVAGTAPHGLYNEEVKSIFEFRVCLFLRDGLFIAHALPEEYVYLFNLAGVLSRLGRDAKVARYQAASRALIEDCHRLWQADGCPAQSDDADYADVTDALRRHLGAAVMDFDERAPAPLSLPEEAVPAAAAAVVRYMGDIVDARETALNDRRLMGVLRDALIESVPSQPVKQRLRRFADALRKR
jgi:hypothetical protein